MSQIRRTISAIFAPIQNTVTEVFKRDFLPVPRRDDDLFLVEFPKSGGTWLTFLLANIIAQLNSDPRVVTLFNVDDFVPGVQSFRFVDAPAHRLPSYRIFKSHANYLSRYRKVVYLVRDPRHVMPSYWKFLRGLGQWTGTLDELIASRDYGIRAWRNHVNGWLEGIDAAACFTLLRYEDLLRDPGGEMRQLCELLGLPVSEEHVATAVERSSIRQLASLEQTFNSRHPALKELQFFRKEPVGGPREPVPEKLLKLIERDAGSVMKQVGYT